MAAEEMAEEGEKLVALDVTAGNENKMVGAAVDVKPVDAVAEGVPSMADSLRKLPGAGDAAIGVSDTRNFTTLSLCGLEMDESKKDLRLEKSTLQKENGGERCLCKCLCMYAC